MSEPPERPFDVGLQIERTALSWQRTILSFGIATLVVARVLADTFSDASLIVGAGFVALTLLVFPAGHQRYRSNHAKLTAAGHLRTPLGSAVPLLFHTVATLALGLLGLLLIAS